MLNVIGNFVDRDEEEGFLAHVCREVRQVVENVWENFVLWWPDGIGLSDVKKKELADGWGCDSGSDCS